MINPMKNSLNMEEFRIYYDIIYYLLCNKYIQYDFMEMCRKLSHKQIPYI